MRMVWDTDMDRRICIVSDVAIMVAGFGNDERCVSGIMGFEDRASNHLFHFLADQYVDCLSRCRKHPQVAGI